MTVAELSIPQGWEEITAQWMTAASPITFPPSRYPWGALRRKLGEPGPDKP
jgi:hypothetical protein